MSILYKISQIEPYNGGPDGFYYNYKNYKSIKQII